MEIRLAEERGAALRSGASRMHAVLAAQQEDEEGGDICRYE